MLIALVMIFCTLLVIGALGGKEKLMNALGAIFLTVLLAVVVVSLGTMPH